MAWEIKPYHVYMCPECSKLGYRGFESLCCILFGHMFTYSFSPSTELWCFVFVLVPCSSHISLTITLISFQGCICFFFSMIGVIDMVWERMFGMVWVGWKGGGVRMVDVGVSSLCSISVCLTFQLKSVEASLSSFLSFFTQLLFFFCLPMYFFLLIPALL